MKHLIKAKKTVLILLSLAWLTGCAMAHPQVMPDGLSKIGSNTKKIAIVPFENLSGYFGVDEQLTKILIYQLQKKGFKVIQQTDTEKPQDADILIRGTVENVLYVTGAPIEPLWYVILIPIWPVTTALDLFYVQRSCTMNVNIQVLNSAGKQLLNQDFKGAYVTPNTTETASIVSLSQTISETLITGF